MKNRVIRAFSLVCCFSLIFSVCAKEKKEYKRGLTAGIVNVAVVNMENADQISITDAPVVMTASAEAEVDEPTYGYTNLGIANVEGNANVREEPNEQGTIVGKLPADAGCEILDVDGDWTHISSGNVEGYVLSEFLLTGDAAKQRADSVAQYVATVTSDSLRVRLEQNTTSEILANMPQNSRLEVVEELGDWVKVNIQNTEGYVSAEFVECDVQLKEAMTLTEARFGEGVSDGRISIVSYATQFVGNPYVWGGTSLTNGADCSGFVLSVYAKYGVYLPHSSRAQANCGRRISMSELKPGDLLFYGSGGGISHVAMYIGGGQIVHASTPRTGIIISSAFSSTPICAVSLLD